MGTFTPRLQLYKPATVGEQVSIAALNANMDKLESAVDRVCTSGTRPGTPFEGMRIYETDTKRFFIYDGGWKYQSGEAPFRLVKGGSHGTVAEVLLALGGSDFKHTLTGLTIGDKYLIEFLYKQGSTISGDRLGISIRHRDQATLDGTPANNTLLRQAVISPMVTGVQYEGFTRATLTATAATHTVGIYHLRAGGSGNIVTSDGDLSITRQAV